MTNKEVALQVLAELGKANALDLRKRASKMDGTGIIAEELNVPEFDPDKDYSRWPVGAPVAAEGQVWVLLQPYNAKVHTGLPSANRAMWGLCHTKDPKKAKAWMAPNGTSGMYMAGECYLADTGKVYRCKQDNVVHDAAALPTAWEVADDV